MNYSFLPDLRRWLAGPFENGWRYRVLNIQPIGFNRFSVKGIFTNSEGTQVDREFLVDSRITVREAQLKIYRLAVELPDDIQKSRSSVWREIASSKAVAHWQGMANRCAGEKNGAES